MYIPHNVLAEAACCVPCLLNFHYDVGRQGLIYPCIKFHLPQCFLCQLHAHNYAIQKVLAETFLFSEKYIVYILTICRILLGPE